MKSDFFSKIKGRKNLIKIMLIFHKIYKQFLCQAYKKNKKKKYKYNFYRKKKPYEFSFFLWK